MRLINVIGLTVVAVFLTVAPTLGQQKVSRPIMQHYATGRHSRSSKTPR
jgi:hypothetical protein